MSIASSTSSNPTHTLSSRTRLLELPSTTLPSTLDTSTLHTAAQTVFPSSPDAPALCSPPTSSCVSPSSYRRNAKGPQRLSSRYPPMPGLAKLPFIAVITVTFGSRHNALGTCTVSSMVNADREHFLQTLTNRDMASFKRSRVGLRLRVVQYPTGGLLISGLLGVILTVIGVRIVMIKPRHTRRFVFFLLLNEGAFFMGQPLGLPLLMGLLFSCTRSRR